MNRAADARLLRALSAALRTVLPGALQAGLPAALPAALRAALPVALPLALPLALGGCVDGSTAGEGEGDPSRSTVSLEPFVGTWDLRGDWNGQPDDQALLVIRPVGADGRARAVIHDLDDAAGCYFAPTGRGVAAPDPALGREVFLDGVPPFDQAVLRLVDGALVIDYFDTSDTDRDGDRDERRRHIAPSVAITETDIGPDC